MSSGSQTTAKDLLAAFAARELSPAEALEACVERIAARDGELRAFVALDLERARREAAAWPRGPLGGVPVGVKDLFDTAGVETAFGSPMFAGRVPPTDAGAVRRLRAAGAVVVGKTATHEFAWGITMRNATLGPTRNPWNPERTPGGSSGGSAVAVAAGMVPLAIGTDTGGSIRLPAALCGVVGFKPTYGRIPLDGVWPLAPSFDHPGPFAASAEDAALLYRVLAGDGARADPPRRMGFALPMEVAPEVEASLRALAAELGAAELELPDAVPAYAPLFGREAARTHREAGLWPERAGEYDRTVRERLEIADRVTEAEARAAAAERARVDERMGAIFERFDAILTPVCAWAPPPRLDDPVDFRPAVTPLICLQNLLGLPAVSVPAGRDASGMPVGLQLFGPRGADAAILAAAARVH